MTITSGDILRTSVNFTLDDGTLYQNIYHHRRVGYGIITDATHITIINDWAEAMYLEIAPSVSVGVVSALSSVDRILWDGAAWEVVENIGVFTPDFTGIQGTVIALPNQVSPFVTFKTARPKTVGRKFLFPLTESAIASAVLSAPVVAEIVAYADDAVNNVVVSAPLDYLVPGVPRTGVNEFVDFTLALVTNLVGTQRRRRRGYGA